MRVLAIEKLQLGEETTVSFSEATRQSYTFDVLFHQVRVELKNSVNAAKVLISSMELKPDYNTCEDYQGEAYFCEERAIEGDTFVYNETTNVCIEKLNINIFPIGEDSSESTSMTLKVSHLPED